MRIEQTAWTERDGWKPALAGTLLADADLVLAFGDKDLLKQGKALAALKAAYPRARIAGCSTAGEISGTQVHDGTIAATAIKFDAARLVLARVRVCDHPDSLEAGLAIARSLPPEELVHVLVISDGTQVNGSALVRGMLNGLPEGVAVTGGLSADGSRFKETVVVADGRAESGVISAIGFYGRRLRVGFGSLGGWDPFGPERLVTRSRGNVLHELDGKPALALYKDYLGEHAAGLPSTGLLFPLNVRQHEQGSGLVRTILSVNEGEQSLTFAGDIPEGSYARLMKANFDRLVDGAQGAARISYEALGSMEPDLALIISCVGRKLVLAQRVEDELEAVRETLGARAALTGFYSYGEICPVSPAVGCEFHNQTMTITTFSER